MKSKDADQTAHVKYNQGLCCSHTPCTGNEETRTVVIVRRFTDGLSLCCA